MTISMYRRFPALLALARRSPRAAALCALALSPLALSALHLHGYGRVGPPNYFNAGKAWVSFHDVDLDPLQVPDPLRAVGPLMPVASAAIR